MAHVVNDRVKETSTTTGTGTLDLAGAATGFQGFVAGIGDGNTTYYCIEDGTDWEVGIGTVTDAAPDTLSRDSILQSSNSDAAVDWGAGTKRVFCTLPARGGAFYLFDNLLSRPLLIDYAETLNPLGDLGGGTDDIDIESGNVVTATVSTATQTFTFSNPSATGRACSFTLELTNGGSQTVNWPAAVDWGDAGAPTLTASGMDTLMFWTIDGGTNWRGVLVGTGF